MENITFQIRHVRDTKINKTSRNIIKVISSIRKLLNMHNKPVMIKISNHIAPFDKKSLTKNIVTEIIRNKEGIKTVNVKTDIDFRFLCKI